MDLEERLWDFVNSYDTARDSEETLDIGIQILISDIRKIMENEDKLEKWRFY